jgi:hypothetical protein
VDEEELSVTPMVSGLRGPVFILVIASFLLVLVVADSFSGGASGRVSGNRLTTDGPDLAN